MAKFEPDRRSLLKLAPAAALVAASPVGASMAADRTKWAAAMAHLDSLLAADEAFTPKWLDAWRQCEAACKAIPHVHFEPETYTGGRRQTTSNTLAVQMARREVAALDAGKMHLDPLPDLQAHYAVKRRLVAAAEERDRKVQAIRDRYDMDRLDEKADQLGDDIAEARSVLMKMPSPDLSALRWKLEHALFEEGNDHVPPWAAEYVAQTLNDVARLLPIRA